jgi:hypothetical protein
VTESSRSSRAFDGGRDAQELRMDPKSVTVDSHLEIGTCARSRSHSVALHEIARLHRELPAWVSARRLLL